MTEIVPVKVFIGSGEASLLERKTLLFSLKKHTARELDINVFNGTHDTVERNAEAPFRINMPLKVKYANFTEFSNYRWYIPHFCNYKGKAIWMDSDIIAFDDIGKLFDTPMKGYDILAVKGSYNQEEGQETFATSVMLIDCEKCKKFDIELYFREIEENKYSYNEMARMSKKFLEYHPINIGELDKNWNVFDSWDKDTKLLHYTGLLTQPWKYHNHPYGELWFNYFFNAFQKGFITQKDIDISIARSYVRKDIMQGNSSGKAKNGTAESSIKDLAKEIMRRLKKKILS